VPTDPTTFGQLLRVTLKAAFVSPGELALRTHLAESGIFHLLSGRRSPSFDTAAAIADALGVPLDWFRRVELPNYTGSVALSTARAELLANLRGRDERLAAAAERIDQLEADAVADQVEPVLAGELGPVVGLDVQTAEREDVEVAYARQRLTNLEPLTDEERRLFESYRRAQLRKGRTDGEALHAAIDRLADVWRGPLWKKRAATIAQERRSTDQPARGSARKRARPRAAQKPARSATRAKRSRNSLDKVDPQTVQ
jgi:transcriptional regulator with XRE-family HTH domain